MAELLPPSLDDVELMARAAWAALPGSFRALAGDVLIRIEDLADEDILGELGIEDPFELTGLYQGVDLTTRSIADPTPGIAIVFLYRRAILDEWIDRGDVTLEDRISMIPACNGFHAIA